MIVGDYFTKHSEAYAMPNDQAMTVAPKLASEQLSKFILPS